MKTLCIYIAAILGILLSGCQRRELTYDYQEGVSLRIEPDWSTLGGEEQPLYVKALFFPTDGGRVVERYIDPVGQEIKVPEGEYNIVVYTWRTNAEGQTVEFRGDTYDTFEAYTRPRQQRMPIGRADNTIAIVPQPDMLYAWNSSMDPVEISYTKGIVSRGNPLSSRVIKAPMRLMVHRYELEINIRNTENINSMYVVLTDVFGSEPLGGGTTGSERFGLFADEITCVSQNGDIATYRCSIMAFGFHDSDKSFILNIETKDGKGQQEIIDITRQIEDIDNGTVPPETPIVVAPKEDPVVVIPSEVGGGGFVPPVLEDWNQQDENIDM